MFFFLMLHKNNLRFAVMGSFFCQDTLTFVVIREIRRIIGRAIVRRKYRVTMYL